ncbi:MAG TPA: VWA domain-containing protein, partial [bacterium]|nr:VWA domain-containing protein [bacterium]
LLPLMMLYDYQRRTNDRVVVMPGASRLRTAMPRLRQGNPIWPVVLRFTVVALLLLAAARPQIAAGEEKDITQGIDIVLAVDVSGSMLAEDMAPNRMEVAKRVVSDFILDQEGNRLGLVAFAGKSLTQSPITTDYEIVRLAVTQLDPSTIGIPGTAIGDAIGNAINKFQDPKAKGKVIILLTDGENNEGRLDPREAAKFARQRGIRVYAIGVGTPGGSPIPNPYAGFPGQPEYIMQGGRVLLTKLDEELLRDIANTTHGQYFIATDEAALRNAYAEIARMEKHEIEIHNTKRYTELFMYIALPALALLTLEIALGAGRYRSFV